ncbi:unnamed protein product [Adineta steineri]|uniref:Uncharacterized protein n=1 Tax=Adineta steineri TaxID=433720 RepID=A0A816E7Y0_9BILA|nr:unnamed protein product [Adineta steineri]CAF1648959.1 unnamed protein product [Adineta steineri]
MNLIGYIILSLYITLTVTLPTCNLSLWINSKDFTCSGLPNSTYTALTYNGNCTMFPNDPDWTTYKLLVDVETKTVQSFMAYNFKNCYQGNELFFTKTPVALDICAPLSIVIGPGSKMTMGSLMFNCKD